LVLGAACAPTGGARDRLAEVEVLGVLDGPGVDPLKLTLLLPGTGADGNAVEQDLLAAGLPVESADRDVLVGVVSLADTPRTLEAFAGAVETAVRRHRGAPRPVVGPAVYRIDAVAALPPRQAFFADEESVPVERAVGRVSAELVAPYPPGIPVLAPGEEVTPQVVDALAQARAAGVRIAYAADPTLRSLRVVRP
jgi:lysine decarboxylase